MILGVQTLEGEKETFSRWSKSFIEAMGNQASVPRHGREVLRIDQWDEQRPAGSGLTIRRDRLLKYYNGQIRWYKTASC